MRYGRRVNYVIMDVLAQGRVSISVIRQGQQLSNVLKTKISNVPQLSERDKEHVYVSPVGDIASIYRYSKQLGKGGTCRVMLVSKVQAQGKQYALKELDKSDRFNEELFAKEIQLLQLLKDNVHVLDFADAYQTNDHFYLATTYCSGSLL